MSGVEVEGAVMGAAPLTLNDETALVLLAQGPQRNAGLRPEEQVALAHWCGRNITRPEVKAYITASLPSTSDTSEAPEGDNRPAAYMEGDTIVLRASSFGSACIRDLVLHLMGEHVPLSTPPELQARFDAGHAAEPHILGRLRALGWSSPGGSDNLAQSEHELRVLPGVVIRFHPDEVMETNDFGLRLVECKALAPSTFKQARSKGTGTLFAYDWQLSVMMLGLGLPAVWVGLEKNPDDAEDWSGELHIEWVDEPPRSKGAVVLRAREIVKAYRHAEETGELPDCQDPSIYPCPFMYLRPEKEEVVDPAEVLFDNELVLIEKFGREYLAAKADEAKARAAKEKARRELLDLAGGREVMRGQTVRFKKLTITRTSWDTDAMRADGLLVDKYKSTTVSERVDVEAVK